VEETARCKAAGRCHFSEEEGTALKIQLSDHFTYQHLMRFSLPSIVMVVMVFLYTIVDGLFVANLVSENAFAAVNVASPGIYIFTSIGHLIGTGGSAVVARTLGEGKRQDACRYFTMITVTGYLLAALLGVFGFCMVEHVMRLAGASPEIWEECVEYSSILYAGVPFCVMQSSFSKLMVAMEKPKFGLGVSIAAGATNVVLDYVFIALFDWGVAGAAWATVAGFMVGGCIPLIYVLTSKKLTLRFVRTKWEWRILRQTASYGISAMFTNSLATYVCMMVFNHHIIQLAGETGAAAYGVITYVDYVFIAVFNGFSLGVAPVISYHFGARNQGELKSLLKKSFVLTAALSVGSVLLAQLGAGAASAAFVTNPETMRLSVEGIRLYSLMYLFCGVSIFITNYFAAVSNGTASFVLAVLRTALRIAFVYLLAPLWGLTGVWLCVVFADLVTAAAASVWLRADRRRPLLSM